MKTSRLVFILPLIVVTLVGCTYTHWKDPISGREFTHIAPAIGNRRIGELDIVKGTMKNYESENAEIARAAAEGAVAAALRQRQQAP